MTEDKGFYKKESSKIECPVCHQGVDFLLGDDTPDGGKRGCEACWKPPAMLRQIPQTEGAKPVEEELNESKKRN